MVTFEINGDGLARLDFVSPVGQEDERDYLAALGRLGRIDQPYVLLAVLTAGRKLSPAGERAQALWYKETRDRMNALCRAAALVRPDPSGQMRRAFSRLWAFPLLVTDDLDAAVEFVGARLPAQL